MNTVGICFIFTVVAVISVTSGLKIGEKCSKHDDCTPSGSHCAKNSDCDDGYCMCIAGQYYMDVDKCTEVTKVLSKGDACSKTASDYKKEPCGKHLSCTTCPDQTTYKCRSKASTLSLTSSILVLIPIALKVFY